MTEQAPPAEKPQITSDRVIEAFRKFPEQGIGDPHALPLDDPQVMEANRILDDWTAQQEALAKQKGTLEAELDFNLDRTMVLVDAGFLDPHFLDHVANDYLINDLETAQGLA